MAKAKDLEHLPDTYNKKIVDTWIGNGEVKREILNQSNYCLLIKDDDNATGGRKDLNLSTKRVPVTYRFIRFFNGGGKTHVSVDWEGTAEDAVEKMTELLTKEYDY